MYTVKVFNQKQCMASQTFMHVVGGLHLRGVTNAKCCVVIFQYAPRSSLPTAPFLLHHNTTTFRCFVATLFYYKVNHDSILYLKRRVVDDVMTSSSTRKICFDSQKVVRYLVETTHYDVRKGNVCLLQTYITSVLRH